MFEREPQPQFNKQEVMPEVKEKPIERLKGEIKDIATGLQQEGVPVDNENRIDVDKFGGIYSRGSIQLDKNWVRDLKQRWEDAAVSDYKMSWLYGREQVKQKVAQENPMGKVWEMLSTKILHQNLGKDFIVARTSEYDDARYKVDNILLDRKTGHIVCAFDEIDTKGSGRFEEKKQKVSNRNIKRGGTDLKYGISFEEKAGKMELKKGAVFQIPLFYMAISEEKLKKTLANPGNEKEVFKNMVESIKEQIKEINEKGPVHHKLKSRLDFFEKVIEKF